MLPQYPGWGLVGVSVLLAAAAWIDVRHRRIPNWLSLAGILAGLFLWVLQSSWSGLLTGFLGLLVGGALFLPIYLMRGMGAGDVKLMAAVGSFLGPVHVFYCGLLIAIVGGVIAAIVAVRQGRLRAALLDSVNLVFRRRPAKTLERSARHESIPYGLAIALGTVIYLWLVRQAT